MALDVYKSTYKVDYDKRMAAARQHHPEPIQLPPIRIESPPPHEATTRLDILEERLQHQERTSAALIEKATRIKEDIVDSLNISQGSWQSEKQNRALLQEHIRTITAVVNRLNLDIQTVDENIRARDNAASGTNNAIKNMEVHQVSSLGDVRGRIVRCDAAITKLSGEIKSMHENMRMVTNEGNGVQQRVTDRIHKLETQLVSMTKTLEKYASEQDIKMNNMEGNHEMKLGMLDSKSQTILEEARNMVRQSKLGEEAARENLETRMIQMVDKSAHLRDTLVERTDRKIEETFYALENRIQKLEDMLMDDRSRLSQFQNAIQEKILGRVNFELQQQASEIVKMKQECRDGFSSVHESINNMKSVVEGKQKILEDQLRKDIGQLRKMIVLV